MTRQRLTNGRRLVLFGLLALACILSMAVAIGSAIGERGDTASDGARAISLLSDGRDTGRPVVLFRSLDGDQPEDAGHVAVAAPGGSRERALASLSCDRVYFAADTGVCLGRGEGFAAGYRAKVLGPDLRVRHEIPVDGIPSRARVSPDGRYGSVTLFVTGHAYAEAGTFSTQTTLIDLRRGEKIADLEQFTVTHEGRQVTAVDVNFWGVTFARDSDRFYATMATGGRTYLIAGSVSGRTAHTLHENVECPSLSPDGTRVAYKKRVGAGANPWRLAVLDLATMRETLLAETRSVDDQAEWLDDRHVLYGIGGEIWTVRADGRGTARRFLEDADSPAVALR
jgi:hypothetical protein